MCLCGTPLLDSGPNLSCTGVTTLNPGQELVEKLPPRLAIDPEAELKQSPLMLLATILFFTVTTAATLNMPPALWNGFGPEELPTIVLLEMLAGPPLLRMPPPWKGEAELPEMVLLVTISLL